MMVAASARRFAIRFSRYAERRKRGFTASVYVPLTIFRVCQNCFHQNFAQQGIPIVSNSTTGFVKRGSYKMRKLRV